MAGPFSHVKSRKDFPRRQRNRRVYTHLIKKSDVINMQNPRVNKAWETSAAYDAARRPAFNAELRTLSVRETEKDTSNSFLKGSCLDLELERMKSGC